MSPAEKRVFATLTRPIVIARAGGLCELTAAPGHDVHHVLHRGNFPQVALLPEFCMLLNVHVHALDNTGELLNYIKAHKGEDWYYALKRRAQSIRSQPLPLISFMLRAQRKETEGMYA